MERLPNRVCPRASRQGIGHSGSKGPARRFPSRRFGNAGLTVADGTGRCTRAARSSMEILLQWPLRLGLARWRPPRSANVEIAVGCNPLYRGGFRDNRSLHLGELVLRPLERVDRWFASSRWSRSSHQDRYGQERLDLAQGCRSRYSWKGIAPEDIKRQGFDPSGSDLDRWKKRAMREQISHGPRV